MKKTLKIALCGTLCLALVAALMVWLKFGSLIKGAMSVEKLDDGLYYMEYTGDDGFDGLVEQGGAKTSGELTSYIINFLSQGYYKSEIKTKKTDYGCSTLAARTSDGNVLMGRNFDYPSALGMIIHTIPEHGYETITTFNMEFYEFGDGYKPEGFRNQYMALA
ncbi:MAG: hypothetical protein IIU38_07790, partial [Bacteroidaceae bacterium]|nr:hypothetical protein [Bacteroidaceae bacterium]